MPFAFFCHCFMPSIPLFSAFCLPSSVFWPLSSGLCLLSSGLCLLSSVFWPLSSVLCLLAAVLCLLALKRWHAVIERQESLRILIRRLDQARPYIDLPMPYYLKPFRCSFALPFYGPEDFVGIVRS